LYFIQRLRRVKTANSKLADDESRLHVLLKNLHEIWWWQRLRRSRDFVCRLGWTGRTPRRRPSAARVTVRPKKWGNLLRPASLNKFDFFRLNRLSFIYVSIVPLMSWTWMTFIVMITVWNVYRCVHITFWKLFIWRSTKSFPKTEFSIFAFVLITVSVGLRMVFLMVYALTFIFFCFRWRV